MNEGPPIAEAAALIGDPARANMLAALMDGRALTATELALIAGVTPQTASGHLAKMAAADLVAVERQGRHRYYRLFGPDVATALESLMVLGARGDAGRRLRRPGPRDDAMRFGRTCYDHLAGTLGMGVTWGLVDAGVLRLGPDAFHVTRGGRTALGDFGIALEQLEAKRRPLARRCLDWSERKPHLAGSLGAALLERFMALGWIARRGRSRTVDLTETGRAGLKETFGISIVFPPLA